MKFWKNLSAVFLVLVLVSSCASDEAASPEKAKQILEKSFKKYSDLTKREGEGPKSVAAKLSIKGSGQLPMGGSSGSSMPLSVDAVVEIYAVKPRNFYLDISGNLGNAKIIVSEKEKATATIILPGTKQFATIDVSKQLQEPQEKAPKETAKPDRMEDFWKNANLEYVGTEKTPPGKAHKINIRGKDPAEKGFVTAYILDGKWDPQRIEINSPEGGVFTIQFDKLEINTNIPDSKFVPDTTGYTQVSNQQITSAIMMQLMSSMMQQPKEQ